MAPRFSSISIKRERRAFAHIVDVFLIGDAKEQDFGVAQAAAPQTVERLGETRDDIDRHRRIDLAGKLDKARRDAELARFPSQIKRVDRNAMAAKARARDRTA